MKSALNYWRQQKLEADEEQLVSDVEKHDCHVLLVSGGSAADWAYSVGLFERFGHPELAIFGLPNNVAHWIINEITSRIRSGEHFKPDASIDGLLEGDYVCVTRNVQKDWYDALFGYATWFYRDRAYPVLQVIWPDKQGLYPWDDGFNEAWRDKQPWLHLSDPTGARMEPFLAVPSEGCTCKDIVTNWSFADDPHTRVITQRYIASLETPILLVSHDSEDGTWQFLDGSETPDDLVVACMHHLIELDPSLNELTDLPLGWQAWRSSPSTEWLRAVSPEE